MSKTRLWTRNLFLITIANFFMFFAFQLFPSALPPYLKSLGASDSLLGWLQGIITVATLIVRPVAGIYLDKYGRKWVFIAGIAGMLIVSASYWFFPVVGIIIFIRFVHGMVWGVANTACTTVATDNLPKERFSEGMGYFSLASSIAMALAPALALALGMHNNIVIATLFMAATLILSFMMKYQLQEEGLKKNISLRSLYERESIVPSFIIMLMMITWGSIITFIALYGIQKSIGGIGAFFTVYALSMLVTRPFYGKLIDRRGFGVGVWSGVVLIPVALLLLASSNNLFTLLICAVIYGIGAGAAQSSLQTMAIINVPKHRTGAANATFFTGFDGGIGIGAVLSGILSSKIGYGNMFALMAVFPILAGVLYISLKNKNILPKKGGKE